MRCNSCLEDGSCTRTKGVTNIVDSLLNDFCYNIFCSSID